MSYSTSAPPRLILEGGIGGSPSIWLYTEPATAASIDGSGYISNGYDIGMRDGDLLFFFNSTSKIWTTHTVLNNSGTTIDLSDGTTIGGSTNTD